MSALSHIGGRLETLYTARPRATYLRRSIGISPEAADYVTVDAQARLEAHLRNLGWFAGCPVRLTRVGEPAGAFGDADVERLLATVPARATA